MRRTVGVGVVVTILLVATVAYVSSTAYQGSSSAGRSTSKAAVDASLSRAADYLLKNYNPALGLIPEYPNSSVYWLYSDNFLAALALSQYGGDNSTIYPVAANISISLGNYLPVGSTENQYTTLEVGSCDYRSAGNYAVASSAAAQIDTVVNNGTGSLDRSQYADIAFLTAVCSHHNDDMATAITAYDQGLKMFDGTGLRDLPYNQTYQYQTYKLALFIYASVVLGEPLNDAALSTLLGLQAPSGGFYTGYDSSHFHASTLTNTETTSLAMLALQSVKSQQG